MGKQPNTFGRGGVDPDQFSDDPHGDEAHATAYLHENGYRIFVNETPGTPQDGDRRIDTSGDGSVGEDVYDADDATWRSVASSDAEYTDTDVENFLTDPDNGITETVHLESVGVGLLSGNVVGRPEDIDNLEGNVYLEPEGTDPGTVLQNDGDMVFIHE